MEDYFPASGIAFGGAEVSDEEATVVSDLTSVDMALTSSDRSILSRSLHSTTTFSVPRRKRGATKKKQTNRNYSRDGNDASTPRQLRSDRTRIDREDGFPESTKQKSTLPVMKIDSDDEESGGSSTSSTSTSSHSPQESFNEGNQASKSQKEESSIEIPMGEGGDSAIKRSSARTSRTSLSLSSVFPSLKEAEEQLQPKQQLQDYFSMRDSLFNSDDVPGPFLNIKRRRSSASYRDASLISNVSWEEESENTMFDESLALDDLYGGASKNNLSASPHPRKRAMAPQRRSSVSDMTNSMSVFDVFNSKEKESLDSKDENRIDEESLCKPEEKRRRTVRFVDEPSFPEWIERDHPKENLSQILDIYNESVDAPYSNDDRKEFGRVVYNDADEASYSDEYDSDAHDDDSENPEKKVVKGILYSVGGMAVAGVIGGASKLISAFRKSKDEDTAGDIDESIREEGKDAVTNIAEGMKNARRTSDVMNASDALHVSELASEQFSAFHASINTCNYTALPIPLPSGSASVASSATATSKSVASASVSTSASASAAASSAAKTTISASAAASSAAKTTAAAAVPTAAAFSTGVPSAATAAVVASAAVAGQATAEAVATAASQTAVVQSMAISAASVFGGASATVAEATTAAILGAAGATATATTSTTATLVTTVGALGIAIISTGGTAGAMLSFQDSVTCPEVPIPSEVQLDMYFERDSFAAEMFESDTADVSALGEKITELYNDVSHDCYETHQRRMLNCTYEWYEVEDTFHVVWSPWLVCNGTCPMEDPLFGIDSDDLVTQLLKDFDPSQVIDPSSPISRKLDSPVNETSSSAPPPIPIVPFELDEFTEKLRKEKNFEGLISLGSSHWIEPQLRPTVDQNVGSRSEISDDGRTTRRGPIPSDEGVISDIQLPIEFLSVATSLSPSQLPSDVPSESSNIPSHIPTGLPSHVPSNIPSHQPSGNPSELPSYLPSSIPSRRPSNTPSELPTESLNPSTDPSANPSESPSDIPSATPSTSPSESPSDIPSSNPSERPSDLPSYVPSSSPSDRPSGIPSDAPSSIPSASPSDRPIASPSANPTASPTISPSDIPSSNPSERPSDLPSASASPSDRPSASPSQFPSSIPSSSPSDTPSSNPSERPSDLPSYVPSYSPSDRASGIPSEFPSTIPSASPSSSPSQFPSTIPSSSPSDTPSSNPSERPSDLPSYVPSASPSDMPSGIPSEFPSTIPSSSPSDTPSSNPSERPSDLPSYVPSASPSDMPSGIPSEFPSTIPSSSPSDTPSSNPSERPSDLPSYVPSASPSDMPSGIPSEFPSTLPSSSPSDRPSDNPSGTPSDIPSSNPSDITSDLGQKTVCFHEERHFVGNTICKQFGSFTFSEDWNGPTRSITVGSESRVVIGTQSGEVFDYLDTFTSSQDALDSEYQSFDQFMVEPLFAPMTNPVVYSHQRDLTNIIGSESSNAHLAHPLTNSDYGVEAKTVDGGWVDRIYLPNDVPDGSVFQLNRGSSLATTIYYMRSDNLWYTFDPEIDTITVFVRKDGGWTRSGDPPLTESPSESPTESPSESPTESPSESPTTAAPTTYSPTLTADAATGTLKKIHLNITFDEVPEANRWDITKIPRPDSYQFFDEELIRTVDYGCEFAVGTTRRGYSPEQFRVGLQIRQKLTLERGSCYRFRYTDESNNEDMDGDGTALEGDHKLFKNKPHEVIYDSGSRRLVVASYVNTQITTFCLGEDGEVDPSFDVTTVSSSAESDKVPVIYNEGDPITVCPKKCRMCKAIDDLEGGGVVIM